MPVAALPATWGGGMLPWLYAPLPRLTARQGGSVRHSPPQATVMMFGRPWVS